MSTPSVDLGAILPVAVRKTVYALYGVLGIVISAVQVAYAAVPGGTQPVWLTVTLAVVAFLAAPVTALAVSNTPSPERAVVVAEDDTDY